MTEQQLCDCDTCVEIRTLRTQRPGLKVTSLEQWHNLGVAQRNLKTAFMDSQPMAWLARWVNGHPRQAMAVGALYCLVTLAIFLFVEPVQPH